MVDDKDSVFVKYDFGSYGTICLKPNLRYSGLTLPRGTSMQLTKSDEQVYLSET
jgi:hypothetical protein